MQPNHNGVAEYGNYKNYETNSIVTINKYDVDMQYKSPIVFTITGRDYFNRQIDLPTNRNLFNKLTLRELGESIGLNKPISTLFRKLGLSNSIFCTNDIDLRIPIRNFNLDVPITRATVQKLRAILAPNNTFKPQRDRSTLKCDSYKTIQSFILGILDSTSKELLSFPIDFIRYLRNKVRGETFSTKAQFINEDVLRFLDFACGDIPFSHAGDIVKYDPNGVHRLNDYCKFSTTENYIRDEDFVKLFKTSKDDALEKYGATSDIDLMIKYIKNAKIREVPRLTSLLHKIFDYAKMDNTMTGITSVTMLSVLTMLTKQYDDFSFVYMPIRMIVEIVIYGIMLKINT